MKLSKGKIAKLYNKKHQSRRRNKKMARIRQTFRNTKRPLNLATKTLKMRGGKSKGKILKNIFTKGVKSAQQNVISAKNGVKNVADDVTKNNIELDKIHDSGQDSVKKYEEKMEEIGDIGELPEGFKGYVFLQKVYGVKEEGVVFNDLNKDQELDDVIDIQNTGSEEDQLVVNNMSNNQMVVKKQKCSSEGLEATEPIDNTDYKRQALIFSKQKNWDCIDEANKKLQKLNGMRDESKFYEKNQNLDENTDSAIIKKMEKKMIKDILKSEIIKQQIQLYLTADTISEEVFEEQNLIFVNAQFKIDSLDTELDSLIDSFMQANIGDITTDTKENTSKKQEIIIKIIDTNIDAIIKKVNDDTINKINFEKTKELIMNNLKFRKYPHKPPMPPAPPPPTTIETPVQETPVQIVSTTDKDTVSIKEQEQKLQQLETSIFELKRQGLFILLFICNNVPANTTTQKFWNFLVSIFSNKIVETEKTLKEDLLLRTQKFDDLWSQNTTAILAIKKGIKEITSYQRSLEDNLLKLELRNQNLQVLFYNELKKLLESKGNGYKTSDIYKHQITNELALNNPDDTYRSVVFYEYVGGAYKMSYDTYFKIINDYAGQMKSYDEIQKLSDSLNNYKGKINEGTYKYIEYALYNLKNAFYRKNPQVTEQPSSSTEKSSDAISSNAVGSNAVSVATGSVANGSSNAVGSNAVSVATGSVATGSSNAVSVATGSRKPRTINNYDEMKEEIANKILSKIGYQENVQTDPKYFKGAINSVMKIREVNNVVSIPVAKNVTEQQEVIKPMDSQALVISTVPDVIKTIEAEKQVYDPEIQKRLNTIEKTMEEMQKKIGSLSSDDKKYFEDLTKQLNLLQEQIKEQKKRVNEEQDTNQQIVPYVGETYLREKDNNQTTDLVVMGEAVQTRNDEENNNLAKEEQDKRLAEDKLAEDKLAEDKLAEDKLAEDKLAEDKLAEDKLAEDKLAEDKLAEDKLAEDKLAADKLAEDKLAEDKLAADKKLNAANNLASLVTSQEEKRIVDEAEQKLNAANNLVSLVTSEEEKRIAELTKEEEKKRIAKEEENRLAADKLAKEEADKLAVEKLAQEEVKKLNAANNLVSLVTSQDNIMNVQIKSLSNLFNTINEIIDKINNKINDNSEKELNTHMFNANQIILDLIGKIITLTEDQKINLNSILKTEIKTLENPPDLYKNLLEKIQELKIALNPNQVAEAEKEKERLEAEEKERQKNEKNNLVYNDIINSIAESQFNNKTQELKKIINNQKSDEKIITQKQYDNFNNYIGGGKDKLNVSNATDNLDILIEKMNLFIILINSVIYDSQVNLMLNSLNYENYKVFNNNKDNNKDINDYTKCFVDFIFIDISQISQFFDSTNYANIKIKKGQNEHIIGDKLNNDIGNLLRIYNEFNNILRQRKIVVSDNNSNISNRIGFYNDIINKQIVYNKKQNNLIHILELCSFIKTYTDKSKKVLERTLQYLDIKTIINAIMDGCVYKLNKLFDAFNNLNNDNKQNIFTNESSLLFSYIISQNQKYILSYLKLNNFGIIDKYNDKRFEITTDDNANYININYNNDNTKYNIVENSQDWNSDTKPEYKDNYIYGRFDKIYKLKSNETKTTNKEIAGNMTELLKNILLGKLLFIIGYGASGSGKTSTLIHLNAKGYKEEGILIHLCNLLGKGGEFEVTEQNERKTINFGKYTKLTIYTKEFFVSDIQNIGNCSIKDENKDFCKTQKLNFKYQKDNFVVDDNKKSLPIKFKYKTQETEFGLSDKTLGEVLIHLIDTDRFVKSTTNNISSSRSHSLIYVVMEQEGITNDTNKKIQFVIGDLAGVENKFDCVDKDVLKQLMNIGSKETNGKPESNYVPLIPTEQNVEPKFDYNLNTVNMVLNNKGFGFGEVDNSGLEDLGILVNDYKDLFKQIPIEFSKFSDATTKLTEIIRELKTIEINGIPNMFQLTQLLNSLKNNLYINLNKFKYGEDEKVSYIQKVTTPNKKIIDKTHWKINIKYNKSLICVYPLYEQKSKTVDPQIIKDICNKTICLVNMLTNDKIYPTVFCNYFKELLLTEQIKSKDCVIKGGTKKMKPKQKKQTRKRKQKGGGKKNVNDFDLSLMENVRDYAQTICNSRVVEGIYINKTLAELRNHITRIMIHKTKDCIFYSPPFYTECFQYYCPTGANCFSLESNDNTNSELINWIFEQYKITNNKNKETEFYDDLIISMFCVMNLSRTANNPPPIPYINIKKLKQMWAICLNKVYESDNDFSDDNKKITEYLKNIDELLGKYNPMQVSEIDLQRKKMKDSYEEIITNNKITGQYNTDITNLIKIIDNHNAVTAIGTVDYADSFNKLNTPVTNCMTKPGFEFGSTLFDNQVL
jgi:hypothetical protein